MRLSRWIGFLLAAPLAYCQQNASTASPDSFSALVTELPTCSIECFLAVIKTTSCDITNVACLCASQEFEDAATKCVRATCKISEALLTKNLTENACHRPLRNKSEKYSAMNISTGIITVIFAAARLLFKQFFSSSGSIGLDDIVIVGAVAIGIPGIVINQVGLIGHGLGRDVWTMPPTELPRFAMYFFVMEVIYLTEISLIKLSLSLFYLYVFPGAGIRRFLLGTAIFNVIYGVAFVIAGVFQCTPVDYYWTQYTDAPPQGHCVDLNRFAWANAAMSLAVDLWMIALPISQIRKLDLHWKKKIGVTFMFLIGTFVTVISLLRLKSVIYFANLINPTWDQWNVAWWSTLEVNIGIICTCLPTMRLILVRMFPRLLSTNESRGSAAARSQRLSTSKRGSTPAAPYAVGGAGGRGSSMELSTASIVNDGKPSEKPFDAV